MEYKLYPILIPRCCWGSNLRANLSEDEWKGISRYIRYKADGRCQICGLKSSRLDAHEIWEYNDIKHIQKLKVIKAVCKNCHDALHVGRTLSVKDTEEIKRIYSWICTVNRISFDETKALIREAWADWEIRSQYDDWTTIVDDDYLKELLKEGSEFV